MTEWFRANPDAFFNGRKTTINFTFITERSKRSEFEGEVKGILENLL